VKISVNGESHDLAATQLAEALIELGYAQMTVATALNGNFVAASTRAQIELNPGDQLEVLAPMQGG
jgi:sulfur carrier protein